MADDIKGVPELAAAFATVRKDMQTRVARAVVVSAGNVLKKEAKSLALGYGLRKTGALLNNIAIKRERTQEGVAQYHLGVRHGRNITKAGAKKLLLKVGKSGRIVRANDPFYWSFLEFTTKHRTGTPFIGAALENKRDEAIKAMETRLAREIEKANNK